MVSKESVRFHVVLWVLVSLAFVGGIFSFIEPVPILVLLYPSFILLFQMTLSLHENMSNKIRYLNYLIAISIVSAGVTIGTFDYLTWLPTIPLSLLIILIICIINKLWLQLTLLLQPLTNYNKQRFYLIVFIILSYPTMMTTIFILLGLSPLSSLLNISNGLWYFSSLAQFASIFGIHSITFLHLWFTALLSIYLYCNYINKSNECKLQMNTLLFHKNILFFATVIFIICMYGGFRLNVKHFYHQNPSKWRDNDISLRTLCITENTLNWQSQTIDIDLILTEEEYTTPNDMEYKQLISFGQQISYKYNHSVMIGIGIYQPDNSMELWIANQSYIEKVYTYLKGNPVPFIETFKRRRQTPPVIDMSEYGFNFSISSLICFDMAYVDWSILAHKADLILNPSWLWGSFMDQFVNIISFRAMENGYNIFHCAENGNTAAIDGYGDVIFKHVNNKRTNHLTVAEISGHKLSTFYSNIGFVFDYIVIIFGAVYILFCIIIQWKKEYVLRCLTEKRNRNKIDNKKLDIELHSRLHAEMLTDNEDMR